MRLFNLIILIIFFTFEINAKEIKITFDNDSVKYWGYISDRTMGGVSNGQALLDQDGDVKFARLTGNVSTDNNGGFIQLRSTLSFANLNSINTNLQGVRIKTRGNNETYHIFIRTSETQSYRDFYYATFVAKDKWKIIDLPFTKFKHRFYDKSLNGNDIRTFAIVAYGRDFTSDVSVSEIIFY